MKKLDKKNCKKKTDFFSLLVNEWKAPPFADLDLNNSYFYTQMDETNNKERKQRTKQRRSMKQNSEKREKKLKTQLFFFQVDKCFSSFENALAPSLCASSGSASSTLVTSGT